MIQEMMTIKSNEEIADNIYKMVLQGELVHKIKEPGQFIHIKVDDPSMILRRPISIASYNENQLTILYKIVGGGTQVMANAKEGESIDVLGPLGNGFKIKELPEKSNILLVGAGIGIAPLYQLSKELHQEGHTLNIVLSYKTKDEAYYVEEFSQLGNVHISTDDGSLGMCGYCASLVETLDKDYDYIYSCGPRIVLQFVQEHFKDLENVYLSLEERMGCGIGACHACDTRDKKKRVCKDGPVFNAKEVEL